MKTSELTGAALDWAVVVAEWIGHEFLKERFIKIFLHQNHTGQGYCYSRDWAQAGPIIEREGIQLARVGDGWEASVYADGVFCQGPTPLVAAMRCYVASKLGAEVEIPEEICQ
jgi:hypothetical protein